MHSLSEKICVSFFILNSIERNSFFFKLQPPPIVSLSCKPHFIFPFFPHLCLNVIEKYNFKIVGAVNTWRGICGTTMLVVLQNSARLQSPLLQGCIFLLKVDFPPPPHINKLISSKTFLFTGKCLFQVTNKNKMLTDKLDFYTFFHL